MLYITTQERISFITMGTAGLDNIQATAIHWTPQYRIVLSRDLITWILVEGKVLYSFTNFITVPELSGPLYLSPDIYHTQITEYLL